MTIKNPDLTEVMSTEEDDRQSETNAEFSLPMPDDPEAMLVVGIGASAGGVEALSTFFDGMPSDSGMAFVVVLHMSPKHDSYLAELLARRTSMTVAQVTETIHLKPNNVYVVSPAHSLVAVDGILRVVELDRTEGRRTTIDRFFRTLAGAHGSQSIAIVLSGAGEDGANGLKKVKEVGGLTMAQEPSEALQDSMPRSAIATGMVDYILPAEKMGAQLATYQDAFRQTTLSPAEPRRSASTNALVKVLTHLRSQTGHDFSCYKRATVQRRIARRMQVHGLRDIPAYLEYLQNNTEESERLLRDLLISVTQFFRDPDAWEALQKETVGNLFEGKGPEDEIRVWVCGCATGEEAYTVAILLMEHAATLEQPPGIQIFATDMDANAIAVARDGSYPQTIEDDVPSSRLRNWFYRDNGRYVVRKEVREKVLFAFHDVLRDTPFSRLELITCRNLLIYLTSTAQARVFDLFHFSLLPEGRLFLGTSESVDATSTLFGAIDKANRIFVRRPAERILRLMNTGEIRAIPTQWNVMTSLTSPSGVPNDVAEVTKQMGSGITTGIHYDLLESLAPPSVLVGANQQILHISPRAGNYLRFAGGEPTADLMSVVHPDLRPDLSAAFYAMLADGMQHSRTAQFANDGDGAKQTIRLTVQPVSVPDSLSLYTIVLFEPVAAVSDDSKPSPSQLTAEDDRNEMLRRMDGEIMRLRTQLRLTVEQTSASSEELKASNEELQAINEELRSATEELETGKEELQSVNEELTTVNSELKTRVDEVSRINSDLQNLMASTNIGTIFLNRELKIKRYTPAAAELFHLIPTDVGRPLQHLRHSLDDDSLPNDAQKLLDTLVPIEREVSSRDGRFFLVRLLPYRTSDDHIDGVVITFTDITGRYTAEANLNRKSQQLEFLFDTASQLLSVGDIEQFLMSVFERLSKLVPLEVFMHHTIPESSSRILHLAASHGIDRDSQEQLTKIKFGDAVCGSVVETRVSAYIPAVQQSNDRKLKLIKDIGITAYVCFPLITGTDVYGTLSFARLEAETFSSDELSLMRTVVDLISNAIEHSRSSDFLLASEERFRLLVDGAQDYAMLLLDTNKTITFWSAGAARLFGWTEDEAIGQSGSLIFAEDDLQLAATELGIAHDYGSAKGRRRHIRKDSTLFWADGVLTRLNGDEAVLRGYASIMRDATAERVAEEELQRAHDDLEARVVERTASLTAALESLERALVDRDRSEAARRELTRLLVAAQEDERGRISRELHDQMGQDLTGFLLGLKSLEDTLPAGSSSALLAADLQQTARKFSQDLHHLAWDLRPPALDDLGLEATLSNYLMEWGQRCSIETELHSQNLQSVRLSTEAETALYRISQEALTNVVKHARATRVSMLLERRENEMILIIEDNGIGFDTESSVSANSRLGIQGMMERALLVDGILMIESEPGEGTTLFIRVPIQDPANGNTQ